MARDKENRMLKLKISKLEEKPLTANVEVQVNNDYREASPQNKSNL
jgi:hypothetical protein